VQADEVTKFAAILTLAPVLIDKLAHGQNA
jgi:hypothetical protein